MIFYLLEEMYYSSTLNIIFHFIISEGWHQVHSQPRNFILFYFFCAFSMEFNEKAWKMGWKNQASKPDAGRLEPTLV